MTNPYDDRFQTSSGLPLDGATVTITAAVFDYRDFARGKVCFTPTYHLEDEGIDQEQSYTVGSAGRAAQDGSQYFDPPKKIPGSSNFGMLLNSLVTALAKAGIDSPGAELGDPYLAASWVGTRWTMIGAMRETANPDSPDEVKERVRFVFDTYLGRVEKGKSTASIATVTPATNTELFDALVAYASTFDDHESFVDAAFDKFPEAEKDVVIRKAIVATRPGTIWAARSARDG